MAQELNITVSCPACGGTGLQPIGIQGDTQLCLTCGGTGELAISKVTVDPGIDDVINKCNDILDKCNDILEKVSE